MCLVVRAITMARAKTAIITHYHVFFVRNPETAIIWIKKIFSETFTPTKYQFVSIKHLLNHIIRNDKAARVHGTVLILKHQIPKLTEDAFPTIFLGQPLYLTKKATGKGK